MTQKMHSVRLCRLDLCITNELHFSRRIPFSFQSMTGFLHWVSFKIELNVFIVMRGYTECDEMCRKMKQRECIQLAPWPFWNSASRERSRT